jgi:type VI secretion system protein ImpE
MTTSFATNPGPGVGRGDPGTEPGLSPFEQLRIAELRVRREPGVSTHRWQLFQWLCVVGQWERAIQQLQACAQLDASRTPVVHAYRQLVRAELARAAVLAGRQEPGFVTDDESVWMRGLCLALGFAGQGHVASADAAREAALDLAPLVSGKGSGYLFSWIGDSDSRLGPVCEFIVAGRYRWISFDDIGAWCLAQPAVPVDLVWAPCTITMRAGPVLHGFMPARYPDLGTAASTQAEREALLMGRKTIWCDSGQTGVIASGAKTWTTSAGDFGLFELAGCMFDQGFERTVEDAMGTREGGSE